MVGFVAELAKSGRSTCQGCKEKIEQGALRLGVEREQNEIIMTSWYHPRCYRPSKKKLADMPDVEGVRGFDGLVEEHQKVLRSAWEDMRDGDATPVKRKSSVGTSGASSSGAKKLKSAPESAHPELEEKYRKMTVDALKCVLKANKQPIKGNKDELIERCIDGEAFGAMPQCPACESATLVVDNGSPYENGIGVFKCPGYWDAELRSQIVCVFSTHNKDAAKVERRPWTMQAVEEEEEAKPSPAEKIADDIKGKPPKEAAHLMMTLARESRLSLPTDDGQAIQNIGRFLMASKDGDGNWNAAEAYALLEKEYPTQVLYGSSSDSKKVPAALVPANTEFAETFMEMARMMKAIGENTGEVDFFKVQSYVKVAGAIRSCTIELESWKQIRQLKSKKDTKLLVAGIGESAGKVIEDIRENGRSEKLESLREEAGVQDAGDAKDGDDEGGDE